MLTKKCLKPLNELIKVFMLNEVEGDVVEELLIEGKIKISRHVSTIQNPREKTRHENSRLMLIKFKKKVT